MMTDSAKTVVQTLTVIVVLVIGGLWWNWDWFTARNVRSDLNDYSGSVRRSMVSLEEKEKLLDEIDGLKDLLAGGATIDGSRWGEADSAIRDLMRFDLDSEDAVLVSRELRRMKRDIVR